MDTEQHGLAEARFNGQSARDTELHDTLPGFWYCSICQEFFTTDELPPHMHLPSKRSAVCFKCHEALEPDACRLHLELCSSRARHVQPPQIDDPQDNLSELHTQTGPTDAPLAQGDVSSRLDAIVPSPPPALSGALHPAQTHLVQHDCPLNIH